MYHRHLKKLDYLLDFEVIPLNVHSTEVLSLLKKKQFLLQQLLLLHEMFLQIYYLKQSPPLYIQLLLYVALR